MKKFVAFFMILGFFMAGTGWANTVTLQFNPMDIFKHATADQTRINQQGTARLIKTYNYGANNTLIYKNTFQTYTDGGAVTNQAAVAEILDWTGATAGYQGASFIDIWLFGVLNYEVARKSGTPLSASVNGETGWDAYPDGFGDYLDAIYNTVLGAPPQYAISPVFQPALNLWSLTGDFSVGGADLVSGQQYTMWFTADIHNWPDGVGGWGKAEVQGSIIGTVVPEPATMLLLGLGLVGLAGIGRKLRK